MIDESMDKEAMAQPPKPYEFRSKPCRTTVDDHGCRCVV